MMESELAKEKGGNYLLVQRYDYEMVREIWDKIKDKCQKMEQEQKEA